MDNGMTMDHTDYGQDKWDRTNFADLCCQEDQDQDQDQDLFIGLCVCESVCL